MKGFIRFSYHDSSGDECKKMLNQDRLVHLVNLITENGWDRLLLYGHSWRKDYFRSLVNFNFQGPHAAVCVSGSGEMIVLVTSPWDLESVSASLDADVCFEPDLSRGLQKIAAKSRNSTWAIGGYELMEARFVDSISRETRRQPVSATARVEELRRVKNSQELDLLKRAASLADRGYRYFVDVIEIGMKEYELVAEVEAFLKANGAEDNFMLIASGGTEVLSMKPPSDRQFQKGESVLTELTPQVGGYYAQICRTLVLGDPSTEQKRAFAIFFEAQQAAEQLLRPGVKASDVARVQNEVFRKYGYGEYTSSNYTRVRGHCLGLHFDEHPYILEDVNYEMTEGMVLIAHPNTYLPLSGYMVFGDTLVLTDRGCTALNHTQRELFQKEV